MSIIYLKLCQVATVIFVFIYFRLQFDFCTLIRYLIKMPDTKSTRCIQWAMWGNESSLLGASSLVAGGIIAIVGGLVESFLYWLPVGIYGLLLGLLITIVEYPRGKKSKGKSVPRDHQGGLTTIVNKIAFVKNYYARSIIYIIVALPAGLIAPTLLGAVGMLAGAAIYMGAAAHGEKWEAIVETPPTSNVPAAAARVQPPSQPPPRLPPQL